MRRKPRIGRFLSALELTPGAAGAIRSANLSAAGVARAARLVHEAEQARHGQKRRPGGPKSAKATRPTVERQMRAVLRQAGNPRDYFREWAAEYGYTVRNLGNILRAVSATGRESAPERASPADTATIDPKLARWLSAKARATKTLK